MLSLIEKICAKLLANHIKGPTSLTIDPQQIGFLEGRNIMDNLLTFKLAQEYTTKTKQEATLLKIDFMKAYDQVQHVFF